MINDDMNFSHVRHHDDFGNEAFRESLNCKNHKTMMMKEKNIVKLFRRENPK